MSVRCRQGWGIMASELELIRVPIITGKCPLLPGWDRQEGGDQTASSIGSVLP